MVTLTSLMKTVSGMVEAFVPLERLMWPVMLMGEEAMASELLSDAESSMRMISMVVELAVAPAPSKTLTFHSQVP